VRKADAQKHRDINSLRNKKTVVTENSTLQAELEKVQRSLQADGASFQLDTTQKGGTDKSLLSGVVDFIALDTSQALQVINKNSGAVSIAFPIGDNQSIGWGFPKSAKWLQTEFKRFVDQQKSQDKSKLNQIFHSYYGVNLLNYERIVQSAQSP